MFDVPYPPGIVTTTLDLVAAFLIAANCRRFAGLLGLAAGTLIVLLVEVGRANVLLVPLQLTLFNAWWGDLVATHACFCGLMAVIFRGFFSGRIQTWWRLL